MSRDLNKVQLIGRLGADPESRHTHDGTAVTTFRVASNRSRPVGTRNAEGQTIDETEWFKVVAWDKLGEVCGEYLRQGSRVYIEGRLKTRSWEDQAGQMRYSTEVVTNDLIMLDPKPEASSGQPANSPPGAERSAVGTPGCSRARLRPSPGPGANRGRSGRATRLRMMRTICRSRKEQS